MATFSPGRMLNDTFFNREIDVPGPLLPSSMPLLLLLPIVSASSAATLLLSLWYVRGR